MSILGERDPTFVGMQRYEGNIAVVEHPTDTASYGDGSMEISGSLRTDFLRSATPNTSLLIKSPVIWQTLSNKPSTPTSVGVQMYSDGNNNGRIIMVDSTGTEINLNPLQSVGDIMTFDGLKNTTVRVPAGFPGQSLTCDPDFNYSTKLSWKSNEADVQNVYEPSDGYLRYSESYNSTPTTLTNTPQQIYIDTPLRTDEDAYSIAKSGTGGIVLLQGGTYEVVFSLTVSFDQDVSANMVDGFITCIKTYIENSDPSGFSVTPSTRNYHNIPYIKGSNTDSSHTLTTRCILNVTPNTRLRFYAQEYLTTTGALIVKPTFTKLSVIKLAWNDSLSHQYLVTRGIQDARPNLSTEFITIPITTVTYSSNPNDVINADSITLAQSGTRHVCIKMTFAANNVNNDTSAVIQSQVIINSSTVPPPSGITKSTVLGSNGNTTSYINMVYDINAGDTISIQSRILSSNLTTGNIVVVSEECSITISMPNQTHWKRLALRSDLQQTTVPSRFTNVTFNLVDTGGIHNEDYIVVKDHIRVINGGTYQYIYDLTLQNQDTKSFTGLSRLVVDSGSGWKEVPGSLVFMVIEAGTAQSHYQSSTVYLPPNSNVKCQVLSPDGGIITVADNSAHFVLSKYENTKSVHVGKPDFGRFHKYVYDDLIVITTSTIFSLRLAAMTINLPEGNYRLGLSFEWDMSNAGVSGFETQLLLDNVTVVDDYAYTPIVTGAYTKVTSFQVVYLSAGEHYISFNTRVLNSTTALYTRKVRIEFWKL